MQKTHYYLFKSNIFFDRKEQLEIILENTYNGNRHNLFEILFHI